MSALSAKESGVFGHACRGFAALLLLALCGCGLVSDAKLKEVFGKNKDEFSTLLRMANEDRRVVRIDFRSTALEGDSSWPRKDIGFSEQRWDEYRSLFRELGITSGIERRSDFPSAVFFYAECAGSAVDRDCKGYAYSEKPLTPVKGNLDDLAPGVAFAHLGQNWYLFRDGG